MPARSAPPPPPPDYVMEAVAPLTQNKESGAEVEALFADDVVAFGNGVIVARGKAAWLRRRRDERSHYYGGTIGYSYSTGGVADAHGLTGHLLVLDTFDTVDIANPRGPMMDPRMTTRSILYGFGPDRLIHEVRMSTVPGFWVPFERRR